MEGEGVIKKIPISCGNVRKGGGVNPCPQLKWDKKRAET